MNAPYAGHSVMLLSASSRVVRWLGNQPPAGQPSASCLVMNALKEMSGFTASTGASEPLGITTPLFNRVRQA